jgi:hypothetical protein
VLSSCKRQSARAPLLGRCRAKERINALHTPKQLDVLADRVLGRKGKHRAVEQDGGKDGRKEDVVARLAELVQRVLERELTVRRRVVGEQDLGSKVNVGVRRLGGRFKPVSTEGPREGKRRRARTRLSPDVSVPQTWTTRDQSLSASGVTRGSRAGARSSWVRPEGVA